MVVLKRSFSDYLEKMKYKIKKVICTNWLTIYMNVVELFLKNIFNVDDRSIYKRKILSLSKLLRA